MAKLSVEHVTRSFGAVTAVKDVSLTVDDGEFVVLLGPSGCGKSTLLRLIAGLEEPSSGRITLDGIDLGAVAPAERDVAFVRMSLPLYPHLPVRDNLTHARKLHAVPAEELAQRVDETAKRFGLQDLLDRRPWQLTSGQRMRVSLARALVRRPRLLLLDEPLHHLDAKLRVQTRAEIIKLQRQIKATTLFATHDTVEALVLGDRVAVMRDGAVLQVDAPQAIYDHPANMFVAGFVGSPAINFFRSEIKAAKGGLAVDTGAFTVPLPDQFAPRVHAYRGKPVILGIRPEDIYAPAMTPPDATLSPIRADVEVVERIGKEAILWLVAGEHNPVARIDSRTPPRAGEQIELLLDTSRLHVFDPVSQATVV